MYILCVVIKSNKFNTNFKVTNNEHISIHSLLHQESKSQQFRSLTPIARICNKYTWLDSGWIVAVG